MMKKTLKNIFIFCRNYIITLIICCIMVNVKYRFYPYTQGVLALFLNMYFFIEKIIYILFFIVFKEYKFLFRSITFAIIQTIFSILLMFFINEINSYFFIFIYLVLQVLLVKTIKYFHDINISNFNMFSMKFKFKFNKMNKKSISNMFLTWLVISWIFFVGILLGSFIYGVNNLESDSHRDFPIIFMENDERVNFSDTIFRNYPIFEDSISKKLCVENYINKVWTPDMKEMENGLIDKPEMVYKIGSVILDRVISPTKVFNEKPYVIRLSKDRQYWIMQGSIKGESDGTGNISVVLRRDNGQVVAIRY